MKRSLSALVLVAASVVPTVSMAEGLSYNSVSVSYEMVSTEIDGINDELDGDAFSLRGIFEISDSTAVIMKYGKGAVDLSEGGDTLTVDVEITMIGALYHAPANESTDVVVGIGLVQGTIDMDINGFSLGSESVDGHSVRAGLRSMLTNEFEVNIYLDQSYIEDESDSDITVGAAFYVDENLSIEASMNTDDETRSTTISLYKYY